jgi:hypothetical protein
MFYVVETEQQLQKLEIYRNKPSFIEIIPFSDRVYPKLGKPSLLYYRPLTAKKGFILAIDHLESLSIRFNTILAFLGSLEAEIWTIDKKMALHYGLENLPLKGLKMAYALSTSDPFPDIDDCDTSAHKFYHRKLKDRLDVNRFIPISKHLEKYDKLFKKLEFPQQVPGFEFYNKTVFDNFYKIEDNGIRISPEDFDKHYPQYDKSLHVTDDKIYTEFIFYNITSRPTCKFNHINFLSLKKKGDSRKFIIPDNDILVEFDYKSYQVKILADLLGFKFTGDIHEQLGKQMNADNEYGFTMDRQYVKLEIFRKIYGRETEYNGDIPFFKAIYEFRNNLWREYQRDGYITSPISGRRLRNILEITQVLPFLMQCIETERNSQIIERLHKCLTGYKTKIILYTYDAFLLDFSLEDGGTAMNTIKLIIESDDYTTTMKYGDNYSEMELFNTLEPIFI